MNEFNIKDLNIDVDKLLDTAKEAAEEEGRKLLEEWKPTMIEIGIDTLGGIVGLVSAGEEEKAIEELKNASALDCFRAANVDVEDQIEYEKKIQAFIGSLSSAIKAVGGKVLTSVLFGAL